jgi:hypothetical protein
MSVEREPPSRDLRFDLLKDHYDNHARSANYLLTAHGVGLVACLTAVKDYAQTPQFKGIGVLIVIFCIGLLGSILAYASLAIGRFYSLNQVVRGFPRDPHLRRFVLLMAKVLQWPMAVGLVLSLICLVGALGVIIVHFARL